MSTSQAIFTTWVRTRIAPRLRERGFDGSGQDFHRRLDRNWQAVNVQRSSWNSADETKFTINLGTASAAVIAAARLDADIPPREVLCHWRTRIGSLLPGGRDTWWTIRSTASDRDLDRLAAEVGGPLIERCLPELDRMVHDSQLLDMYLARERAELRPFEQDVVGPLLRELGPPDRLASYLATIDASPPALEAYASFDLRAPRMGPARKAKALGRLQGRGWEARQQGLIELAHATGTPDVRSAVTAALDDPIDDVQMAAAYAAGHLAIVESLGQLLGLIESAPRYTACHAALAGGRLAERLDAGDRQRLVLAIRARHADAVGHERPLLGHVLHQLEAA